MICKKCHGMGYTNIMKLTQSIYKTRHGPTIPHNSYKVKAETLDDGTQLMDLHNNPKQEASTWAIQTKVYNNSS